MEAIPSSSSAAAASASAGSSPGTEFFPHESQPQGTEYVCWVQYALNRIMNYNLPVSGIMDFQSRSAMRRFQRQAGLMVTGFVDPLSERALVEALSDLDSQQNLRDDLNEMLSFGLDFEFEAEDEINRKSKEYIRWVQGALNRIMGLGLTCDGIVGNRTQIAIRAFQRRNGLTPDGIVGSQTEQRLVKAGAGNPPTGTALAAQGSAPAPSPCPEWIEWVPSIHHRSREGRPVSAIIYHYTAGPSLESTVQWFKKNPKKVSAHYVVGKDGRIVQMVPLDLSSHHTGPSRLPGCPRSDFGVNPCSIGIEIVNRGVLTKRGNRFYIVNEMEYKDHKPVFARGQWWTPPLPGVQQKALIKRKDRFYIQTEKLYKGPAPVFARGQWWEPYTPAQIKALVRLTRYLLSLYPGIRYITGHEDIAPGRKHDPGGAFDWDAVRAGIGDIFFGHVGPLGANPKQEIGDDDEFDRMMEEISLFPNFDFDDCVNWRAPLGVT